MKNKLVIKQQVAAGWLPQVVLFKVSKIAYLLAMLFTLPSIVFAQADSTQPHAVDMATTMRSNGKIYVVVAVLSIILFGLFFYLIRLDRKISKLEKE